MQGIINLTSGEDGSSPGSTATTASISPSANKLILISVGSKINGSTPNQPTISGNGITWEAIASIAKTDAQRERITLFRGVGSSPTPGTISIDFGGQNQERITWIADEVVDFVPIASNGAAAIVQAISVQTVGSGASSTTSLLITLAAMSSNQNLTYGVINIIDGSIAPDAGLSELAEADSIETNHQSQYRKDGSASCGWSFSAGYGVGIAIEIKTLAMGGGILALF